MQEEIDLLMCAVAYTVARVLHVLSFIKMEVRKLWWFSSKSTYFIINNFLHLFINFCFLYSFLSNVVNVKRTFQ